MPKTNLEKFLDLYPEYPSTCEIDKLREEEYPLLAQQDFVYMDYTGAGLYAISQLQAHQRLLTRTLFGNPHSWNIPSQNSTELVEQTRSYILKFFNASPEEYVCVFTSNASAALKLVGEAYPFGPGCRYLLTFDNHNSVNGIREYAYAKGATVTYLPVVLPDLFSDDSRLKDELANHNPGCFNLFAYPAQSNFSGVQHSLEWIETAHSNGWDVLLDAAAFVPTNKLDLNLWHPDFLPVSFYKMFGFPTGVGALIARKETLLKFRRSWFAGGTTTVASVRGNKFYPAEAPAGFEDGTLNYLNIPAVRIGLQHIEAIGIEKIHKRVAILTDWLLQNLKDMEHSNNFNLVKIYGPLSIEKRGGTISLNFFDSSGKIIPKNLLEKEANLRNISIRMGFFCNPGAGEVALDISGDELASCFSRPSYEARITDIDFQRCIDPKASGAVRVSLGMVSNFEDIQAFLEFARHFLE